MFIDVTCAENFPEDRLAAPERWGGDFGPVDTRAMVAAEYWDEHCVECGAPACYQTCGQFLRNPARCCSRFWKGMRPVPFPGGRHAVAVHFRQWGKMELYFKGRMADYWLASKFDRLDLLLSAIVRKLNVLSSVLIPFGRRTLLSAYRHLRELIVMRRLGRPGSPNVWRIGCYSASRTSLMASIVQGDGEIFMQRLDIEKGWNKWEFTFSPVVGEAYFRIYSIEGTPSSVFFTTLELLSLPPAACPAKFVKCLVWDLDNTLWDGILVEDGPDGIRVRQAAVDLIKTLDSRGIMNSIASKNDWELVRDMLNRLGLLQYFVFPEVNWGAKSESVQRIAKNMNLGIDAFAFIDDSPNERAEVSGRLPMVRVYTQEELEKINQAECFNPKVSSESAKRRMTYLDEMKRHQAEAESGSSHVDFIKDSQILLSCSPTNEKDMARCWELVNRTNQLTLAANRYTQEEFARLVNETTSYVIRCRDKYGDYGIVGYIAILKSGSVAHVREFVMSCRVAKKFCEQSVLAAVIRKMGESGSDKVVAQLVRTGRNGALFEAFDAMPFKVASCENCVTYEMDVELDCLSGMFCNRVEFE